MQKDQTCFCSDLDTCTYIHLIDLQPRHLKVGNFFSEYMKLRKLKDCDSLIELEPLHEKVFISCADNSHKTTAKV